MVVPFTKVQSIGNDFVLIELSAISADLLSELAIAACERRYSIGGDGLLAVGMEGEALRLRMFNPDGTEDFCGNGLRCAAVYAQSQGWVPNHFVIRHLDREVETRIGEKGMVMTELGFASYRPLDVPHSLDQELFQAHFDIQGEHVTLSALSTGSTHSVILVQELPDDKRFLHVSKLLEHHPLFPDRTSVIWAKADGEGLSIRIWERGVGETQGCGTGSSAAANVYARYRNRGGSITVTNPGGQVVVSMADWRSPISIEGKAEIVYRGDFKFVTRD